MRECSKINDVPDYSCGSSGNTGRSCRGAKRSGRRLLGSGER